MEYEEYVIFTDKDKDGNELEFAVVDEFEFEKTNYVVGAIIEGDIINEEGLYIYKSVEKEDDFDVEKINDPKEYERIAKAYIEMEEP